jgi:hypothetical protein
MPKQALSWIWAVCAGTAFGGSALLALAMVGTLDMLVLHSEPGSLTHGLDLSAWLILWAALAMIGIMLTTVILRQPLVLSRTTLAVTIAGVALAAAFQLALQQWAAGRNGYSHDLVGLTILIPGWVVGMAVSFFALDQAPAPGRPWVRAGGFACIVAALAIIAMNVNGAIDGIAPDSWAPALLLMLIAVYALIAAIRLRRREQSEAPR